MRCAEVTACASVGCVNVSPDGLGTRALAGDKKTRTKAQNNNIPKIMTSASVEQCVSPYDGAVCSGLFK